ncbi:MAG: DUF1822 family protein, partial [Okeania sp. SIO2H7]|nr:DUF1822 family protein [Okeania sp. SIO2H7]
MMTYTNDFDSITDEALLADAECVPPVSDPFQTQSQTITLSSELLDRARNLCQTIRPAEQWQAYQNAIALLGVQQWLAEREMDISTEMRTEVNTCSVYGGAIAGLLSGVGQLTINGLQVGLIPIGSLTDDWIAIPRAMLELDDYVPQLFIGIDVREERQQVTIWGSLRLDTLQTLLSASTLDTDQDWTYRIPQQWFTPDPDAILLYLRCLDVDAL